MADGRAAGDDGGALVSICIPVYNGAAFLDACLDSVLAQTYVAIEVLAIDDGSQDGSHAILERRARDDSRLRVHRNERNLGLVGNWNRAIELARGRWIKLAFQDDLLDPACVAALLDAATRGDVPFAACGRHVLFDDDASDALRRFHAAHDALLAEIHGDGGVLAADAYASLLLARPTYRNLVGEPTVTLVRRDVFDALGGFNAALVQICDAEMWDRIATNHGIAYVSSQLATFRVHSGSASERNRNRTFRSGVLDEIVLLHAWCHAPQFARLRAVAVATGRLGALRARLAARVHEALDRIRWREQEHPTDDSLREQFDEVTGRLEGLRVSKARHWLHRVRRRFGSAPVGA